MFATFNEKKARKGVDPTIEGQNGATARKLVRLAQRRRLQTRGDRPFNILGCFALLHAVRSINSGDRSRIGTGASAKVPQVPQVHQSCVRTDLSTVRQRELAANLE